MRLWTLWLHAVYALRPACRRQQTFLWMLLVLLGLSVRPEQAGITSLVRVLDLRPETYQRLLHLFHSTALCLDRLTDCWVRLVLRLFDPIRINGHLVCVADGLKTAKEGKKMPAVKKLYQSGGGNSKPPYIMGHSFQAISLLVRSRAGSIAAVPLVARIHEGLIWSNRDRRSLLDKMVALLLSITGSWKGPVLLLADAFYASRKVILPLLHQGHHLITRVRINTTAYLPAPRPSKPRRGRPRLYGKKLYLRELATQSRHFETAPSPLEGEGDVEIQYRSIDLLWRPIGRLVRFVIVQHPQRGTVFLMATDITLDPLAIVMLYSYRFKIEVGFKHAIHVMGTYAYHFWMKDMTPIRRRTGDQYMHRKSEDYRNQVRRKMHAYHLHVQLGCIAQGLLLYLALHYSGWVWRQFRGWLRTMNPQRPPSELVTAHALREWLPEFLHQLALTPKTRKIIRKYKQPAKRSKLTKAA